MEIHYIDTELVTLVVPNEKSIMIRIPTVVDSEVHDGCDQTGTISIYNDNGELLSYATSESYFLYSGSASIPALGLKSDKSKTLIEVSDGNE